MTDATDMPAKDHAALRRGIVIAITSFLTQVDLFAAQAILPSLTEEFGVSPAAMGFAVNASTIGMAVAGLAVALIAAHINRKLGIVVSLLLLVVPTFAIAFTRDLETFTALRIAQGLCMSAAFTLTMAYLAENCTVEEAAGALAAYITGAVASNFIGRLLAAGFVTSLGVSGSFIAFAVLNLVGAIFVWITLSDAMRKPGMDEMEPVPVLKVWRIHLANPRLLSTFAIGFIILFVFIGVFTFVNFILAAEPFALSAGQLGLVYLVFIPSMITTPLAGSVVLRYGRRTAFWGSCLVTGVGLALLLSASLVLVLIGLALVSIGLFFGQAVATGFVGQAATADRATASGLYLASYYGGGLVGSAILGGVYAMSGWSAILAVMAALMALAALLGARLVLTADHELAMAE